MDLVLEYINNILPLSQKEIDEITPFLSHKSLPKDAFILQENEICSFLAFVKKGTFRSFHVNPNGASINLHLASEMEFVSNYESYLLSKPSNISIQAIEDSEVNILLKKDLDLLLDSSLYWNKLGRMLTENIFVLSKLQLESMIYKSAEERYLDLIAYSPNFLHQFSLTDIASYLGVTPQSLSRIRARVN